MTYLNGCSDRSFDAHENTPDGGCSQTECGRTGLPAPEANRWLLRPRPGLGKPASRGTSAPRSQSGRLGSNGAPGELLACRVRGLRRVPSRSAPTRLPANGSGRDLNDADQTSGRGTHRPAVQGAQVTDPDPAARRPRPCAISFSARALLPPRPLALLVACLFRGQGPPCGPGTGASASPISLVVATTGPAPVSAWAAGRA